MADLRCSAGGRACVAGQRVPGALGPTQGGGNRRQRGCPAYPEVPYRPSGFGETATTPSLGARSGAVRYTFRREPENSASHGEPGPLPFPSTGPHGHRARMREKLLSRGPDTLADYELLEMLLYFAMLKGDTKPLAK